MQMGEPSLSRQLIIGANIIKRRSCGCQASHIVERYAGTRPPILVRETLTNKMAWIIMARLA